jgi:hypothetical protein
MEDRMTTETTALAVREDAPEQALTVGELSNRIQTIQGVMARLMKDGTHYGKVPGCGDKPTLLKPGIDLLAATFQIALAPEILEQSCDDDEALYRIQITATSAVTGRFLGSAQGFASTKEKKYRWRRPVHPKEWEAAEPSRRRVTWDRQGDEQKQVRQEPGDVANTILQMAVKRASGAVIRQVTACSDIFAQDLEDLPEGAEPEKAPMPRRASETTKTSVTTTPNPVAYTTTGPVEAATTSAAAPADDSKGVNVTAAKIAAKGKKQNGQDWTLHAFTTSDGIEWITFSTSVYAAALKALNEGYRVVVLGSKDDKGKWMVEEITKA